MWRRLAEFILKNKIALIIALVVLTIFMAWQAAQVQIAYTFNSAIPSDNPKAIDYRHFKETFGEDGNMMVIGLQTDNFFQEAFFSDYHQLTQSIASIKGVENVLSIPGAFVLTKDTSSRSLKPLKLVPEDGQISTDSIGRLFQKLPFYKNLLYNPDSNAYLMMVNVNPEIMGSARREAMMDSIKHVANSFGSKHNLEMRYSGLPIIRTEMATLVKKEMSLFLVVSLILTAGILFYFFRSINGVIVSILVVGMGVVWAMGSMHLLGFKINLMNALIPPLIVVIGIPNCVYFLGKYLSEYKRTGDKRASLIMMVERMAIVTLFTNLTAAIGFGVFFFTKSKMLGDFGLVAGLNVMGLFVISCILLPALLYYLPAPKRKMEEHMETGWMHRLLERLNRWVSHNRRPIYFFTLLICVLAAFGVARLKAVGYIVDDLPKGGKLYQDMKFFERNFGGVMPLEIVVDAKRKNGAVTLPIMERIESLNQYLATQPELGRKLSFVNGVKFARQAYYDGDSSSYGLPNMFDAAFIQPYLRGNDKGGKNDFNKLLLSFLDSNKQQARISISMADVGSVRLPQLLDSIRPVAYELFDTTRYHVTFTGTSVVFLEGSQFIINSLRDSLIIAFIMIFGTMVLLFRSWRMVLISVIVNVVPLLITAGIMGWAGIVLKPSTVLVFSIALGITIDVTIRFLVSYRQELKLHGKDIPETVRLTIHETGSSIIYTSLILIAGFCVFLLSEFDGTKALGYLTSLTLFVSMVFNLTLQPALIRWLYKNRNNPSAPAS